jgi:hypothetical protein
MPRFGRLDSSETVILRAPPSPEVDEDIEEKVVVMREVRESPPRQRENVIIKRPLVLHDDNEEEQITPAAFSMFSSKKKKEKQQQQQQLQDQQEEIIQPIIITPEPIPQTGPVYRSRRYEPVIEQPPPPPPPVVQQQAMQSPAARRDFVPAPIVKSQNGVSDTNSEALAESSSVFRQPVQLQTWHYVLIGFGALLLSAFLFTFIYRMVLKYQRKANGGLDPTLHKTMSNPKLRKPSSKVDLSTLQMMGIDTTSVKSKNSHNSTKNLPAKSISMTNLNAITHSQQSLVSAPAIPETSLHKVASNHSLNTSHDIPPERPPRKSEEFLQQQLLRAPSPANTESSYGESVIGTTIYTPGRARMRDPPAGPRTRTKSGASDLSCHSYRTAGTAPIAYKAREGPAFSPKGPRQQSRTSLASQAYTPQRPPRSKSVADMAIVTPIYRPASAQNLNLYQANRTSYQPMMPSHMPAQMPSHMQHAYPPQFHQAYAPPPAPLQYMQYPQHVAPMQPSQRSSFQFNYGPQGWGSQI